MSYKTGSLAFVSSCRFECHSLLYNPFRLKNFWRAQPRSLLDPHSKPQGNHSGQTSKGNPHPKEQYSTATASLTSRLHNNRTTETTGLFFAAKTLRHKAFLDRRETRNTEETTYSIWANCLESLAGLQEVFLSSQL